MDDREGSPRWRRMAIPCRSRLRERRSRDLLRRPAAGGKPEYVPEGTALCWLQQRHAHRRGATVLQGAPGPGNPKAIFGRYPREGQGLAKTGYRLARPEEGITNVQPSPGDG